ncbi:MAG: hypothetical protein ACYCX4_00255 [Bacillota bacterium]
MKKLYKDSLTVFLRSKNLNMPFFLLLVLILAYFGFCFKNYLQWKDIFSVSIWLVRSDIFLIAFLIYCSYELTIKIHDNNMVEYLKTYEHGLLKTFGAIILSLLTILVIPSVMFFAFILFMYYYANVQYLPFLIHLIKLSVLYFGISFLNGIMLGVVMAVKLKINRLAVYSLTIILILINTTFTVVPFRIPYLLFNSYMAEKILYYIKDFLTVTPYDLGNHFAIQPIYGFPMEPIRWVLAAFWVLFPLTLILTECFNRKTNKALLTTSCLIVLLGVGLFSVRGSTLLLDMRVNSFPFADPNYYTERSKENYNGYVAGFTIKEYKMNLKVSNELHAEVELNIDNRYLDSYEFTLYHGYILKTISTEKGEIPFTRHGDYISIGSLNGARRLIFKYYGKSPKYYANMQAITLPGYFAYYPKAGRSNIWDQDRFGYVINTSPNESIYIVKIQSNLKVLSNLAGRNNSFYGKSNGLSLFAGMYDEVSKNIYAEPMREDLAKKEYLLKAEELLRDLFNRLERPEPEAFIHLSDKKFFLVPRSFYLNSNTEDIVIMSDHITSSSCNNGQELAMSIMGTIIKPKSASDSLFRRNYLNYLFDRQDMTNPIFKSAVNPNLIIENIKELQLLNGKYSMMIHKIHQNMNEPERKAFITDQKRKNDLELSVNENAAKYLFFDSDSPSKDENIRIFFDYFTSETKEDYLNLVERIIRREMERDHNKKSE